jgi:ubiquinone/menaquinone biosynthesis C-methylase UbiE
MLYEKIKNQQHTCPWWFLFTFDNPLRKLYQDPYKILSPYVTVGDRVVDLGCGMGYFSVPLAHLVGSSGQVIAVDLQKRMLDGLRRRVENAELQNIVQLHQCSQEQIGVTGPADFILAFWMLHEVHDPGSFLVQIVNILRSGGKLLIAEPYFHVSSTKFTQISSVIQKAGLREIGSPQIGFSRSLLVQKE